MSRWNGTLLAIALGAALSCGMGACSSTASSTAANPQQSAIDLTYNSYVALDQAILAADAAVKAGTLKGNDARRTLTAMTTAKAGLDAALVSLKASAAAPAVSGAAK